MLYGVDVSEFQTINFDVLNPNAHFIMIRSCFGTARQDLKFAKNRDEARRVGLVRGFYHYAYPEYDVNTPEAEADFFAANVMPLQPGEILALDWEESYSGDHVDWCHRFLNRVYQRTNVKPLLYLNQSLMNSHDWSPVIKDGYGLWLADYDYNPQGTGPNTPWPVIAMRQWTDKASVPGISGGVDADVFYGDFVAFAKYGYQPAAPLTVSTPTSTTTYKTETGAQNAAIKTGGTVTDANGVDATDHLTTTAPASEDKITQIEHRLTLLESLVAAIDAFLSRWKRYREFKAKRNQ